MIALLLLCSSQANFQYGSIPQHTITYFDDLYKDAWIGSINCDGVLGIAHKYYISDELEPIINATIETLHNNNNFKFFIEIYSNYIYKNNIECAIQKINDIRSRTHQIEKNINPYYVTELIDDTYFILHEQTITLKKFIIINKDKNLFVEFYNTTHTGIRWHNNDSYCIDSIDCDCVELLSF